MKPELMDTNICLIVIDGWGVSSDGQHQDAITDAQTPVMTELCAEYPYLELTAHGQSVGLPSGLMGNSEVGHLNIGAGRVVYQDIVRIDMSIKNGDLEQNASLVQFQKDCLRDGSAIHLVGLISDGGVHSHIEHVKALLRILKGNGMRQVFLHAITDGRDVGPQTALKYLHEMQAFMTELEFGVLASVIGRYFAMDRDNRSDRTASAYELFTDGKGMKFDSIERLVADHYSNTITDEFFPPSILPSYRPVGDADGIIFFNFRSDRMRQIATKFQEHQVFSEFSA